MLYSSFRIYLCTSSLSKWLWYISICYKNIEQLIITYNYTKNDPNRWLTILQGIFYGIYIYIAIIAGAYEQICLLGRGVTIYIHVINKCYK